MTANVVALPPMVALVLRPVPVGSVRARRVRLWPLVVARAQVVTWDQLQEGDILILPLTDGGELLAKLVEPCRNCHGPESWNFICACEDPDCPRTLKGINVRKALTNPGVKVLREGVTHDAT